MPAGPAPGPALPFGCVVLAAHTSGETAQAVEGAGEVAAHVASLVELAVAAGAAPIVAVVEPHVAVPAPARAVGAPGGRRRDPDSALRAGLAQLANVPVTGAVIWGATEHHLGRNAIFAVVEAARASGAPIVVPLVRSVRRTPVYCARDTWRELLTTPGGLDVVMELYGTRVREVEVDD